MTPGKSYQENYVYEWRGIVSYRTPLPFWNARGQFSGVLGNRAERFEARGLSPARTDGANQNWTDSTNTLRYRYYVEDGLKFGGAGTLPAPKPGFTYNWIQTGFASVEHKDIYYAQAIGALQLWDDRVSLTGGVRNDDLNDDQYGNIGGFNDVHGLQGYGGFVPGTGTRPGAHNLTKAGALTGNAGIVGWADKAQHDAIRGQTSEAQQRLVPNGLDADHEVADGAADERAAQKRIDEDKLPLRVLVAQDAEQHPAEEPSE